MTTAEQPQVKKVPTRSEVNEGDRWDLSSLYPSDDAWESDFQKWETQIPTYETFRGTLAGGADAIARCLKFDLDFDRLGERLGTYAFLKTAEDTANSTYQRMQARYLNVASKAGQVASYIRPEIMAIDTAAMDEFLQSQSLAPYRLLLQRILRYKPYTLSDKEEKLLAMQAEMSAAAWTGATPMPRSAGPRRSGSPPNWGWRRTSGR